MKVEKVFVTQLRACASWKAARSRPCSLGLQKLFLQPSTCTVIWHFRLVVQIATWMMLTTISECPVPSIPQRMRQRSGTASYNSEMQQVRLCHCVSPAQPWETGKHTSLCVGAARRAISTKVIKSRGRCPHLQGSSTSSHARTRFC